MQILWGKILAGEIKSPKSYSLRTLEVLKNLSKDEAECFMKFCQAKASYNDSHFICNNDDGKLIENEFGITFKDRLLMTELGLISSEKNLGFFLIPTLQNKDIILINYGKKGVVLFRNENVPEQQVSVLIFTKTGIELSKLIEQKSNQNYLENICSSFTHSNVKIEYGNIIYKENGDIHLLNKKEFKKE